MNVPLAFPSRASGGALALLLIVLAPSFAHAQAIAPAPTSSSPDETKPPVQLSPFEVIEDKRGYFGANSMSGTRLNSKLEDLAAAITVVTKEQMADFAMLDLNDVFLYSTSTEGTGDYTDFAVNNNGHVADNVMNPRASINCPRPTAPAAAAIPSRTTRPRAP